MHSQLAHLQLKICSYIFHIVYLVDVENCLIGYKITLYQQKLDMFNHYSWDTQLRMYF